MLGRNAWGSSFVVGAGRVFPNCMQSQIANLSGSLNGRPPLQLGATVDGPNPADVFTDLGLPGGAHSCPAGGANRFRPFDARGARYMDDARAWPSVEPTLDYTALGRDSSPAARWANRVSNGAWHRYSRSCVERGAVHKRCLAPFIHGDAV